MDTPGTHIQRLIDTYGNREAGYKPCRLDTDGRENPRKGKFVIAGCTMNQCSLEGGEGHRCSRCSIPIHNLFVQEKNLTFEGPEKVDLFCSEPCSTHFIEN